MQTTRINPPDELNLAPSVAASGGYDALMKERTPEQIQQALAEYNYAHVKQFAQCLPDNAKVLDFGSGLGATVNFLHQKGISVVGLEISKEFIRIARGLFPDCAFHHTDFTEIRPHMLPPQDGVYEKLALMSLPREGIITMFGTIYQILKPNGVFQTSFELDEPEESGWRLISLKDPVKLPSGEEMNISNFQYFHYYMSSLLIQDLEEAGFRILNVSTSQEPHTSTRELITVLCQKSA